MGNSLDLGTPEGRAIYNEILDKVGRENVHKSLTDMGYDSIRAVGESVVLRPENIRSRFAKFDPAKRGSSDILASMAPIGLGTVSALPLLTSRDD